LLWLFSAGVFLERSAAGYIATWHNIAAGLTLRVATYKPVPFAISPSMQQRREADAPSLTMAFEDDGCANTEHSKHTVEEALVTFAAAAYNPAQLPKLLTGAASARLPGYKLVGRWRFRRSGHLGSRYLNLSGPATVAITDDARSKRASTSNTVGSRSGSLGRASTKWTKARTTAPPNRLRRHDRSRLHLQQWRRGPSKAKRGTSPTACQCKLRRLCLAKVNFSDLRSDTSQIFAFALADKNNYTPEEDGSLGVYGKYSMHLGNLLWQ
jgi:hypothetical protein